MSLLMLGAGSASPTVAATTITAPYHGLSLPSNGLSESGCNSHASLLKHWHFTLSSGIGVGEESAKAGNCGKNAPAGLTPYSSAYTNGGFTAYLKLPKISAAATSVNVSLGGSVAIKLTANAGTLTGACKSGLTTYMYNDTYWEWNWTGSYFAGYAYMDSYSYSGVTYNYSYNTASIPSPFNLNNTTYYSHSAGMSVYGSCSASAYTYMDPYVELYNAHTHSYLYWSSMTGQGFRDAGISVYNSTDWGWSNSSYWDGPYNYSSSSPTTFFSYNASLASSNFLDTEVNGSYSYSNTLGNSTSVTNTSFVSLSGTSFGFTGPFNPTNLYYAEVVFYLDTSTSNNWGHGSASALANAGTGAFDVSVPSISIT